MYAADIRANADLYDKALANWTPTSREALQGKVKPSSLALIESVSSGSWGNAASDYLKSDENGQKNQGTIFDTLTDVKAAERELISVERQLTQELAEPGISDAKRQETETQLQHIRTEIRVADVASDLVLTGYDTMVRDGKLEGLATFAKETAIGLAALVAETNMASFSSEARTNLQNRAAAVLALVAAPSETISAIQQTYEYADALERQGDITAAAALRTETDLALASALSGVGGVARGTAVGLEKLAGVSGKLVVKAKALFAKGAPGVGEVVTAGKTGTGTGTGIATAATDAEAGYSPAQGLKLRSMSNEEVRLWYHKQLDAIPGSIDTQLPLQQQAIEAVRMRNMVKLQARELMAGQEAAAALKPIQTWEQTVSIYVEKGFHGDSLWQAIIGASKRSNAEVDAGLGLSR